MTDPSDASEYCKLIEKQDFLNKTLFSTIPISEDNSPLVSLRDTDHHLIFEPSIQKDYAYLVREAVFQKIQRICAILNKQDKTLIIRSAWRSFDHQRLIWNNQLSHLKKGNPGMSLEEIENKASCFIAPETKSMHATGGAVDALIYNRKNDCVMDFGTNDGLKIDLNEKCYPYHPNITDKAKKNRKLLIDLFLQEGFVVDIKEYWHFDFGNINWAIGKKEKYAIYDVIGQK